MHITLILQLPPQRLGPTIKHPRRHRPMQPPHPPENGIPIRSPEIRRAPQTRDGIDVRMRIVDHDVGRIIRLNLSRQVGQNLNVTIHILHLDGRQQRAEPFETAEIPTDPDEIDLAQTRLLPVRVVHAVPDGFEDGGERGDADAGADEDGDFVAEDVFRCAAEGAVEVDARHHFAESRVDVRADGAFVDAHDGGTAESLS